MPQTGASEWMGRGRKKAIPETGLIRMAQIYPAVLWSLSHLDPAPVLTLGIALAVGSPSTAITCTSFLLCGNHSNQMWCKSSHLEALLRFSEYSICLTFIQ